MGDGKSVAQNCLKSLEKFVRDTRNNEFIDIRWKNYGTETREIAKTFWRHTYTQRKISEGSWSKINKVLKEPSKGLGNGKCIVFKIDVQKTYIFTHISSKDSNGYLTHKRKLLWTQTSLRKLELKQLRNSLLHCEEHKMLQYQWKQRTESFSASGAPYMAKLPSFG